MTVRSLADLLAANPVFAGLEPDRLELIAGCGRNVHFGVDEMITTGGDDAERFFVIRRGQAAIEIAAPQGPLVVETVGPGDLLGVSWLFPPHRWSFDARATEPLDAVALDAVCLRGKCDEDPALGYDLFQRFAGLVLARLQATRLQLLDLYAHITD